MKIMICDDQIKEMECIVECCREYIESRKINAEIKGVTDPAELAGEKPDILLLDVEMPEENGIEVKDRLAMEADGPLIIFVTNYQDAILEAFNRNVIGFLMKPLKLSQLSKLLDTAITHLTIDKKVRYDDGSIGSTKDILWITANRGYSDFQLVNGRVKDGGKKTLKFWEQELEVCGFIRIDEKHLINARHVQRYSFEKVVLHNAAKGLEAEPDTVEFEIARRRRKECREKYIAFCNKIAKYV
ncbi:Sensory transduction protein lytR [uncultured Eubacterium sp.]|nr:Sensory transduction protein lytR [uncultured Eubacterium sp.]